MTDLDINTPRGQQTLADELDAVAIFESNYPECRYFHTPKQTRADVDGIVIHLETKNIRCVAETKCRYDMTLEKLAEAYNDEWLLTFDKIIRGIKLAEALCVPFYGLLYVVQDKALLAPRLWSPRAGLELGLTIRKTKTQATCNGGEAVRDNAFINMTGIVPLYLREDIP
jgi:hypothetical protein